MINFKEIYANGLEELKALENKAKQQRQHFNTLSEHEFIELFQLEAKKVLLKRNKKCEFKFDDNNREVIKQLFYYLAGSELFEGDLEKGILLLGTIGSGKTIIMQTFCSLFNTISPRKRIMIIKARTLWETVKETPDQFNFYKKRPLYIDDIGKEPLTVKNFGNEINPMAELLSLRYDEGAFTYATGNYNLNTLTGFYGETITDRMKDMFNFIILPGGSRRG